MDRRANKQTKTCEWEKTNIIGDFTKYGQPVPQPDPTRRVGIAYCLLWRRRHPSHDSGAVFLHLISMCFPIGWSRELDETDWRLYVSPNWITIDLGDGFVTVRATPLTQTILIYNWLDPEEQFLMRFQRNSNISFGENALKNVVCKCCPFCHGPNALNLELTSPEWMCVVLSCLIHWFRWQTGCITPGRWPWTTDQFLVTNVSKVCEFCVSMVRYSYEYTCMTHAKPDPRRQAILCQIESESARYCQPNPVPFWSIMAYLRECQAYVTFFVQSHREFILVTRQFFYSIACKMW